VRVVGVSRSVAALPPCRTRSHCGMSHFDRHHTWHRIHITCCYLLLVSVEPWRQLRNPLRDTGAIDNKDSVVGMTMMDCHSREHQKREGGGRKGRNSRNGSGGNWCVCLWLKNSNNLLPKKHTSQKKIHKDESEKFVHECSSVDREICRAKEITA
jgi:hypothetical protein